MEEDGNKVEPMRRMVWGSMWSADTRSEGPGLDNRDGEVSVKGSKMSVKGSKVSVKAARRLLGRDSNLVTGWYEEGKTGERRRRRNRCRCQKDWGWQWVVGGGHGGEGRQADKSILSAGAPADPFRSEPYMPSTAISTRHVTAEYGIQPYHVRPFVMHFLGPTVRHGTRTNTAVCLYCTVTVDSPSPSRKVPERH
jgi:hypothetical protein